MLERAAAVPRTAAARQPPATLRLPVLYVEDHPVNVLLMQALFERLPAERLLVARCVAEALDLMHAQQERCALLLLDLGLPDGRGSDLLQTLRQLPSCRDVPAVAVTAEYGFDPVRAGFDELWEKPLDLPRVLERLKDLLAPQPPPAARAPGRIVRPLA